MNDAIRLPDGRIAIFTTDDLRVVSARDEIFRGWAKMARWGAGYQAVVVAAACGAPELPDASRMKLSAPNRWQLARTLFWLQDTCAVVEDVDPKRLCAAVSNLTPSLRDGALALGITLRRESQVDREIA